MNLLSELQDLMHEGIINDETAERIRLYYHRKEKKVQPSFVFGVLGASLIGLGLILLIAHNWDGISKLIKTILAFAPLIIGQGLCGYSLAKKHDNQTWIESSAVFLMLGFGASITLISQVYHIPGDLSDLLLLWMFVSLPVVYIMRSSVSGLLYIAGITFFVFSFGWRQDKLTQFFYIPLLIGILPYYYFLAKTNIKNRLIPFFNFFIAASLIICLGTVLSVFSIEYRIIWLFYINIFAFYILFSHSAFITKQLTKGNIISAFGHLGILITLFIASFFNFNNMKSIVVFNMAFFIAVIIYVILIAFFILQNRKNNIINVPFINYLFIPVFLLFCFSRWNGLAILSINVLILLTALYFIISGLKNIKLGTLNYGLIILMALVICRFFDTSISFAFRGSAFVIAGIGFFVTNYVLLKKRGKNEIK